MNYTTTTRAAVMLGCSQRTVQNLCITLGFKKTGRDFLLFKEQIEQIRLTRKANPPGRPRKQ